MSVLEVGRVVERYTVEALLGEGGMAAVYRVRHTKLGTAHALKVLTLSNRSIRERLLTEGRVQATLQHPNAVAVQDVLDVDGAPGLLMEFVDGPDLSGWIEAEPYDLALAEQIFRGIVAAVAEAHRKGLVHRDLKPANVLMAKTATGWVPKVADFGLAKLVMDTSGDSSGHATRTGVAMGTPAYMAPEQIRDAKNVDQRADIFSLGCILYQLVTRQQPFVGADIVELFTAVTGGVYVPPTEHVPDLPAHLDAAIAAALVVDREQRVESCEALLEVLDGTREPPRRALPTLPHPMSDEVTVPRDERPPPPQRLSGETTVPPALERTLTSPEAVAPPTLLALLALPIATGGGLGLLTLVLAVLAWSLSGGPADAEDGGEIIVDETPDEDVVIGLCGGGADEVVGYVQAPGPVFLKRKGGVWTLPRERPVVVEAPQESNGWKASEEVACALPQGTVIRLTEEPMKVRGSGAWIAVVPSAVMLPEGYEP